TRPGRPAAAGRGRPMAGYVEGYDSWRPSFARVGVVRAVRAQARFVLGAPSRMRHRLVAAGSTQHAPQAARRRAATASQKPAAPLTARAKIAHCMTAALPLADHIAAVATGASAATIIIGAPSAPISWP